MLILYVTYMWTLYFLCEANGSNVTILGFIIQ